MDKTIAEMMEDVTEEDIKVVVETAQKYSADGYIDWHSIRAVGNRPLFRGRMIPIRYIIEKYSDIIIAEVDNVKDIRDFSERKPGCTQLFKCYDMEILSLSYYFVLYDDCNPRLASELKIYVDGRSVESIRKAKRQMQEILKDTEYRVNYYQDSGTLRRYWGKPLDKI